MQRKAHVRAAVVDGVNGVAVREQTEHVPVEVDDEPPGGAQLGERGGASETVGHDCGHDFLLCSPAD
jgi:hypothetical protein